jgi:hypothetical protein
VVTVEKTRSRLGIGNDRTGAQLSLHDLQLAYRAAPHRRLVSTQTATYVAHFFPDNSEVHQYDVEK